MEKVGDGPMNRLNGVVKRAGLLLLTATLIFPVAGCSEKPAKESQTVDFSNVSYICNLSTLEVYYHDVAQANRDAEGLFAWLGVGHKRMWFEYSGVVRVGIDASRVSVSQPDASNVVTVSLPQAEILGVNVDESTMTDPIEEVGLFTSFTTEERTRAFGSAQEAMLEAARSDDNILYQARQRAREMLGSYVKNVGELMGEEYTINWVDA